jgi:hypothetical protein
LTAAHVPHSIEFPVEIIPPQTRRDIVVTCPVHFKPTELRLHFNGTEQTMMHSSQSVRARLWFGRSYAGAPPYVVNWSALLAQTAITMEVHNESTKPVKVTAVFEGLALK